MEKSFSTLEIKSLDHDKRELEGWASTPAVDRVGDIVEPTGLSFQKEAPLLLNHDHKQPVGTVTFGQPTSRGLPFKAKIAKVAELGTVKDRTDEAWHSVKHGLIKGVSIGFIPRESKPLGNGGTRFTKADVHELSLTAVPANPEATITGIKAVVVDPAVPEWLAKSGASKEVIEKYMELNGKDEARKALVQAYPAKPAAPAKSTEIQPATQSTTIQKEVTHMNANNTNANHFIRAAVAKAVSGSTADAYAAQRWGADSETARYVKAAVNPMTAGPDAAPQGLAIGTISRRQFVQAVFSRSILGRLQGLVQVPAITHINTEDVPTAAAFFGEGTNAPVAQGAVGVYLADKRQIGVVEVVSNELLRMTDDSAEATITDILQRALSRGMDNAFVGSQERGNVSPAGLASVTGAAAATFNAAVEAFTGDLTQASVLLNPLDAVTLRSPTETLITASGGVYGGLASVTSYAVPRGTGFIVDATRVLAYIGDAIVDPYRDGSVYGLGATPTVPVSMFQTAQVALMASQYCDWEFCPGAAVQFTIAE